MTRVLSSIVVCHIILVHRFVVTVITFKVWNYFGSMRFDLMIFQGGICFERFFANFTFLCPCVIVFDMSSIGAWGQPLKLHIIQDHYIEHFELTGETLFKYSDEICGAIHSQYSIFDLKHKYVYSKKIVTPIWIWRTSHWFTSTESGRCLTLL